MIGLVLYIITDIALFAAAPRWDRPKFFWWLPGSGVYAVAKAICWSRR